MPNKFIKLYVSNFRAMDGSKPKTFTVKVPKKKLNGLNTTATAHTTNRTRKNKTPSPPPTMSVPAAATKASVKVKLKVKDIKR